MSGYSRRSVELRDKTKVCLHHWPVDDSAATVLIIHGYAEHGYRYDHVAKSMNEANIEVYAIDLRNHGLSGGVPGYIDRFDDYLDDVNEVLTIIEKPVFLFAHSMGGLIAVRYCALRSDKRIRGLMTSGAALSLGTPMTAIQKLLVPVLNRFTPSLPVQSMDTTYISRDRDVIAAYKADPLVYSGGIRVRTGVEMVRAIDETQAVFTEVSLPLLVLHGTADKLIMPDGSKKLYKDAVSTDKTLKLYDGWYHELVNEPEKEQVIRDIIVWIKSRL